MAGLGIQSIGGSLLGASFAPRSETQSRNGVAPQQNGATAPRPIAGVVAQFSPEALALSREAGDEGQAQPGELTEEEQAEVEQLQQRDREVRQHEQAHVAAGGQYVTSGPRYEYTNGPDGRRYATGGEVSISTSPERTPEETIRKARVIRRAALAPAEPSAQDRRVAAQAGQLEAQARREIVEGKADSSGSEAAPVFPPAEVTRNTNGTNLAV